MSDEPLPSLPLHGKIEDMKIILIAGGVLIVLLAVLLFVLEPANAPTTDTLKQPTTTTTGTDDRISNPAATTTAAGKLKADMFSGTLEEVNTGCFSDGECYVVVDGKHVTVLMGWSRNTVGTIIGAPSIGDLEAMIGQPVEVYAQENPDKTYTLYGNVGFYVKMLDGIPTTPGVPVTQNECVVGGCSSQLCVDASQGDMATTCEYREQYACFKTAECKRQTGGQCGWTDTPELKACIAAS